MQFAVPENFIWLWTLIPLYLVLHYALKRRKKVMALFIEKSLFNELAGDFSSPKNAFKNILLIGVVFFSVVALARPQWGFEWQEIKREALDIVIVIDTSKSMMTQDVKPNRLERTKLAVRDLLKNLRGDRVGLIAFAGDAFLVCPLTIDYNGFLMSLNNIDVNAIPRGGTNLQRAIEESIKSYDNVANKYKAVIIVTDGDNLEGNPMTAAKKAKEEGIKIYTVGIGTKEGELIQIPSDSGGKEFLKDAQGNYVKSRLNEDLLEKIALATGGIYVKSSGANFGLDIIYNQELSKMKKRELKAEMGKRYYERFQWPLGMAFLLLFLGTCLSARSRKKTSFAGMEK